MCVIVSGEVDNAFCIDIMLSLTWHSTAKSGNTIAACANCATSASTKTIGERREYQNLRTNSNFVSAEA